MTEIPKTGEHPIPVILRCITFKYSVKFRTGNLKQVTESNRSQHFKTHEKNGLKTNRKTVADACKLT